MLAHAQEIDQCLALVEKAKAELRAEKVKFDEGIQIGGMIEIPAAALSLGMFIRRLAFLSIGTNDLIQYTLAIDRSDEAVVHLYDPLHPAVLKLIAGTISSGARYGLPVSVCGEIAGDPLYTELLLGMGLRNFSMHPGKSSRSSSRSCAPTSASSPRGAAHPQDGRTGAHPRGGGAAHPLSNAAAETALRLKRTRPWQLQFSLVRRQPPGSARYAGVV